MRGQRGRRSLRVIIPLFIHIVRECRHGEVLAVRGSEGVAAAVCHTGRDREPVQARRENCIA